MHRSTYSVTVNSRPRPRDQPLPSPDREDATTHLTQACDIEFRVATTRGGFSPASILYAPSLAVEGP